MLISDQLKANKTAYAEYLLQLVIQYFVDDDDEESAEYLKEQWRLRGAIPVLAEEYIKLFNYGESDDTETIIWYEVEHQYGANSLDFTSWMIDEGRLPTPPTPPLPQEPLHFRILYDPNGEVWNWTSEEEAAHPGGTFITDIVQAHMHGVPLEFVAYASTDAEADYIPVIIDWNSPYMDSDVLVLTGVPQILEGVRYSSTFALMDSDHYASLKEQVPIPA